MRRWLTRAGSVPSSTMWTEVDAPPEMYCSSRPMARSTASAAETSSRSLRRGGDRAVAAEIRADARQLQMVELILDLKRGVDQFLAAPEALAQIAEVSHQITPVARSALRADRVEGAERFKLALETHVRDLRDLRKLGEHGDADENALAGNARAAQGRAAD